MDGFRDLIAAWPALWSSSCNSRSEGLDCWHGFSSERVVGLLSCLEWVGTFY